MHFTLFTHLKQKYYQTKFSKDYTNLLNGINKEIVHNVYFNRSLSATENQFFTSLERLITNCHLDSEKERIMVDARNHFKSLANSALKANIGYSMIRMV